jgi:hypothetical protein
MANITNKTHWRDSIFIHKLSVSVLTVALEEGTENETDKGDEFLASGEFFE